MAKFVIQNAGPLKGTVRVSGAKNAALPAIAATLLTDDVVVLENIPYLNDVRHMCELIGEQGAEFSFSQNKTRLKIHSNHLDPKTATYDKVNKLRASFLMMGPLLAKTGKAVIPLPGGCAIGTRPVDLHLKGFSQMGAEIAQEHGIIEAKVNGKLKGATIYLDFPSVGATENLMMAAALAEGITMIENAATEPEIVDLAMLLTAMGADIKFAGTDTIRIQGVNRLHGADYSIIPDRIEAGTFMIAAAMTKGDISIENVLPDHVKPVTAKLRESGFDILEEVNRIRVVHTGMHKSLDIKTHPYPGFPTDMQAPMVSLLSTAEGTSVIVETIFENRYMHIGELKRMGANIKVEGRSAVIEGMANLKGTKVKASDLRAGAALLIAGLASEGCTEISRIEHIDRGYVQIEEKLKALGAKIERREEDQEEFDSQECDS